MRELQATRETCIAHYTRVQEKEPRAERKRPQTKDLSRAIPPAGLPVQRQSNSAPGVVDIGHQTLTAGKHMEMGSGGYMEQKRVIGEPDEHAEQEQHTKQEEHTEQEEHIMELRVEEKHVE